MGPGKGGGPTGTLVLGPGVQKASTCDLEAHLIDWRVVFTSRALAREAAPLSPMSALFKLQITQQMHHLSAEL